MFLLSYAFFYVLHFFFSTGTFPGAREPSSGKTQTATLGKELSHCALWRSWSLDTTRGWATRKVQVMCVGLIGGHSSSLDMEDEAKAL